MPDPNRPDPIKTDSNTFDFYEFFAGGGMARAGLGPAWRCLFANDFDEKKSRSYRDNWGPAELRTADVASLAAPEIPGRAHLAWASFPCQDLSLAGAGAGLRGSRSGSFLPFWNLMRALVDEDRAPRLIVMENVCGLLTSHEGRDFAAICGLMNQAGYRAGALVVDAELFVPQSRPRLFLVGIRREAEVPAELIAAGPQIPWHTRALQAAFEKLPQPSRREWVWWKLPLPKPRAARLEDVIESAGSASAARFSARQTKRLLELMSEVNRAKVVRAQGLKQPTVGAVYRRTRRDEEGRSRQRAEVRFDGVSGCLRTPAGGSSRQTVLVVNGRSIHARLVTSRETARLMGLPETYRLPATYSDAYHLTGDGVAVPVVRHLAQHLFEPLCARHVRTP